MNPVPKIKCYDKAHVNLTMRSINYSVGRQQPQSASCYFKAERPLFPRYKIKKKTYKCVCLGGQLYVGIAFNETDI